MCDSAISLIAVYVRTDALFNRMVKSVTVMANAPAQGERASKTLLLVLGADSCAAGSPIHLSVYPGLDHSAVLATSTPEYLSILGKRFADATFATSCANKTKIPFDLENASRPLHNY